MGGTHGFSAHATPQKDFETEVQRF